MVTDEERREVARYLREAAKGHGWLDVYVCHALDCIGGYGRKSPCEVLADLIEPQERTCRTKKDDDIFVDIPREELEVYVRNEYDTEALTRYYILSCGHEFYSDRQPRYCPYCGARIVEVDHADD